MLVAVNDHGCSELQVGNPIDHQNWQQLLGQQCSAAIYNYLFFAHRVMDLNVAPKSSAQVSTNNPISKYPFKGPQMESTDRCRDCDNVHSKCFVLLETTVLLNTTYLPSISKNHCWSNTVGIWFQIFLSVIPLGQPSRANNVSCSLGPH
jgi:hypothetical protein